MNEGLEPPDMSRRASGVLLHPTSLPGGAIGDLRSARSFIDWLVEAGQTYWQILPLVPVDAGGSPYNGLSAFAGNPLLVSLPFLRDLGIGDGGDREAREPECSGRVDFQATLRWKNELLAGAHDRFVTAGDPALKERFTRFRDANEEWLADYTLFRALRAFHGDRPWMEWPAEIRSRRPAAIAEWADRLAPDLDRFAFQQFVFDLEWDALRRYAHERGISIIGDLPIFVAQDSADVWANPEIFLLEESGSPGVVSGVPPDYFSATGQRWGNPLYRWDVLRGRGYDWWVERFRRTFTLVDVVRVDHFRGFESYWEIPAEEETAEFGHWTAGPGAHFFHEVERQLGACPIIVEDLGLITAAVDELRDELGLAGMRVLQFAFDGDPANPHLPENYPERTVAYSGTHDNDTLRGWWEALAEPERARLLKWLGTEKPSNWDMIERLTRSRADLTIFPVQDVLELGSEARMNTPGTSEENWTWRLDAIPDRTVAARLRDVVQRAQRLEA